MLEILSPHIQRCHRIGKSRYGRPRLVIMNILDFFEKLLVTKNVSKVKGSYFDIIEDFPLRVCTIQK